MEALQNEIRSKSSCFFSNYIYYLLKFRNSLNFFFVDLETEIQSKMMEMESLKCAIDEKRRSKMAEGN